MLTPVAFLVALAAVPSVDDFVGRYARGQSVVAFTAVAGRLYVRPVEWSGRQPVEAIGPDRFQMEQRPQRTFVFSRATGGRVSRVDIAGMDENGPFRRLGRDKRPIEHLAEGQGGMAWAEFRRHRLPIADSLALARRLFARRAASAPAFLEFMEAALRSGHRDAASLAGLGIARIAGRNREGGRAALEAALRLKPWLGEVQEALRMLEGRQETGWQPPFSLDAAYAPPTADELRRVEDMWARRDLAPREVTVEDRYPLEWEGASYDVEIVSHLVHGSRHHGAILTPRGALPRSRAVILEVKGVSWDFFALGIPQGSTAMTVLGAETAQFVLVLPGLRGETLQANGKVYRSDGDPAESWDGAADDAIALLNVALGRAAAADPERIAVFGRSRGGTVALLVGERDQRIDRVLAWSAPAGWIEDMPYKGWTQREIAGEGLRRRSSASMIGGQSVRTFLRRAVEGLEGLQQVRDRLIASSPVYFAERLPRTDAHWGLDDSMVESANGRRIRDAAAGSAETAAQVKVFFHAEGGHDLDPALARPASKEFLMELTLPR